MQIAGAVQHLSEAGASLNNDTYYKVAGMINEQISFLRQINIDRLKFDDKGTINILILLLNVYNYLIFVSKNDLA